MPTLAQTIYFEPHGYPGVTVSLTVTDIERVEIQHEKTGAGTPSVITIESNLFGKGAPVSYDLTEGDAEKIGRWLAAHSRTLDKVIQNGAAKFTRRPPEADVLYHEAAARIGQQKATAQIDVALEQVILLARECGKSEEFASDIAAPLKLLLRLMIRDAMVEQSRENRDALRSFTRPQLGKPYELPPLVKDGKTLGGLPVEDAPRPGEKPFGYVVGFLCTEALECLRDVVSHAADFRSAMTVRRLKGRDQDREELPIDAVYPTDPGNEESYWVKQQEVFERMVKQAQTALDNHAKVVA